MHARTHAQAPQEENEKEKQKSHTPTHPPAADWTQLRRFLHCGGRLGYQSKAEGGQMWDWWRERGVFNNADEWLMQHRHVEQAVNV